MDQIKITRKIDRFRKLQIPSAARGSAGMGKSTIVILSVDDNGLIKIVRDDNKSIAKMDDSGITLPGFWAEKFRWKENDEFACWSEDGAIFVQKVEPSCIFTGSTKNLTQFRGKWIAKEVFEEMKAVK